MGDWRASEGKVLQTGVASVCVKVELEWWEEA